MRLGNSNNYFVDEKQKAAILNKMYILLHPYDFLLDINNFTSICHKNFSMYKKPQYVVVIKGTSALETS